MMCNFAPQAKSISYAMSQTPRTFSFAASVWDGTVGGFGGKAINEPDFSGNTYFDNAAIYSGTGTQNKKFLNAFFQAGLLGAGVGGVGTEDPAGVRLRGGSLPGLRPEQPRASADFPEQPRASA